MCDLPEEELSEYLLWRQPAASTAVVRVLTAVASDPDEEPTVAPGTVSPEPT